MKFFSRLFGRCILTKTQVNRYYVKGSELKSVMTHLQREGTYFLAGANSIYVPKGKVKYIDKSVCKPWPDLESVNTLMAPGEAVRTELSREWPELKRVGWQGSQVSLFDWRSPLHYTGQYDGAMIYIDLDGAYSQIYERLWLDTTYPRAYRGQYPLSGVAKRLREWKAARNSLIGICRSRDGVAYKGTKRVQIKMKNKYLSPGLWATVQAILHMIASRAIVLGAIYVNVDGYLFPLGNDWIEGEFLAWLSDLGFRWSIRDQGRGEIVSWNNYHVGSTRTQANRLGLIQNSKEFTNVNHSNGERWEQFWAGCRRIHRNSTSSKTD